MFEEIVKEREKELRIKNILEVRQNINHADYQLKVINFSEKTGFSVEDIVNKIMTDDMFVFFFAKDPKKQNFTEKLVAELLKVEKLPASGKKCIRFNQDGDIVATNNGDVSKSADFYINGIYYTQKYTHESGGAQDNQYNDVRDFLIKGSKKHKVGAIVDGAYWNNKRLQLQQMFNDNPNVVITTVDELLKEI